MIQSPQIIEPPPVDDTDWALAELRAARCALVDETAILRQDLAALDVNLGADVLHGVAVRGGYRVGRQGRVTRVDVDTLFEANRIEVLARCQKALDHIAQLTYGTCDRCKEPIGKDRFRAIAPATLCLRCQPMDSIRTPQVSIPGETGTVGKGVDR